MIISRKIIDVKNPLDVRKHIIAKYIVFKMKIDNRSVRTKNTNKKTYPAYTH